MTEFVEIYRAYFSDVYLYICRLSGDEVLSEEIASETLFKVMRSIGSFRGDCDIRVWLCQIAKNCYFTYLKKVRQKILKMWSCRKFYLKKAQSKSNVLSTKKRHG